MHKPRVCGLAVLSGVRLTTNETQISATLCNLWLGKKFLHLPATRGCWCCTLTSWRWWWWWWCFKCQSSCHWWWCCDARLSVCVCIRRGRVSHVPGAVSRWFIVYQHSGFIHLSVSVTHDLWPHRPRMCRQVHTLTSFVCASDSATGWHRALQISTYLLTSSLTYSLSYRTITLLPVTSQTIGDVMTSLLDTGISDDDMPLWMWPLNWRREAAVFRLNVY